MRAIADASNGEDDLRPKPDRSLCADANSGREIFLRGGRAQCIITVCRILPCSAAATSSPLPASFRRRMRQGFLSRHAGAAPALRGAALRSGLRRQWHHDSSRNGQGASAAHGTVLGWQVTDIAAAVTELQQAGVRFERYDFLKQDGLGIWTAPTGARVAWFKDPDGNILSLSEQSGTEIGRGLIWLTRASGSLARPDSPSRSTSSSGEGPGGGASKAAEELNVLKGYDLGRAGTVHPFLRNKVRGEAAPIACTVTIRPNRPGKLPPLDYPF